MQTSLVSIIIPTYNRAHLIGETLDSVLPQTYKNWECIVIDDGSTDYTDELLDLYTEKDLRIQYHHRPENRPKGANACRNYGFELSKGEYISFLDSDDLISKEFIKKRKEVFNRSNCDFVVANTGSFCNGEKQNNSYNKDPINRTPLNYLSMFIAYKLPWTIMSVTWKREILEIHHFDEDLQRFQDVDFHIRILSEEFQLFRLDEIDNYYRRDYEKVSDSEYIHIVIENFCKLFKKLLKKRYDVDYPQEIKGVSFNFLLNFILPNIADYKLEFDETYQLLCEKNLISPREKMILIFLRQLNSSFIGNLKGIGVYRLNKYLKSLLMS